MAVIVLFTFNIVGSVSAQTTEFNYQGSLKDGANPANGNYDFEFALFDALSGGGQIGTTLTRNAVAVANGTFAVNLDFGNLFPGENRFLLIRVRPSGVGAFTTLTPLQPVNSAPYSVKSLNADNATNATQLGGMTASGFIQNATSPQTANFNISGNGIFGGNVGIGTTEPGFKLEVVNPSNTGIRVATGAAGGTVASFGGNGKFYVDAPFIPGGRLTILENGNVGIGQNNPTAKLDVNGTVQSTSGGFKFPDGTGQTTAGATYTAFVTTTTLINGSNIVATTPLPAGTYFLTATMSFVYPGLDSRVVYCSLSPSAYVDSNYGITVGGNSGPVTTTLHTVSATTFGATPASVSCYQGSNGGGVNVTVRRLTAVRLAGIVPQ